MSSFIPRSRSCSRSRPQLGQSKQANHNKVNLGFRRGKRKSSAQQQQPVTIQWKEKSNDILMKFYIFGKKEFFFRFFRFIQFSSHFPFRKLWDEMTFVILTGYHNFSCNILLTYYTQWHVYYKKKEAQMYKKLLFNHMSVKFYYDT